MSSKLVRDNIPNIIRRSGRRPQTHIADQTEYDAKLKQKLEEEVQEFIASDNIEELADILDVINAIAESKNLETGELEKIRTVKAQKNGGFSQKIILDAVED
jgi:predicted house-cleaning noncanonical NTP pyrophosphatase (MazG superfamily)